MASLYPEAVKKAQVEIDSVVGRERIPSLDDRLALPYTDALVQEVMRMYPPAPVGMYMIPPPLFPYLTLLPQVWRIWLLKKSNSTATEFQRAR
jgi:cytochrome P450